MKRAENSSVITLVHLFSPPFFITTFRFGLRLLFNRAASKQVLPVALGYSAAHNPASCQPLEF